MITLTTPAVILIMVIAFLIGAIVGGFIIFNKVQAK